MSAVGLIPQHDDDPADIYKHVYRQTNGNQKIIRRIAALTNGKAKKMVRDELQLEAEGEFPAHWRDTRHEEDGTDKEYIRVDKPDADTSANEIDFGSVKVA